MHDTYSRAGNATDPPYLAPDYMSTRTRAPRKPLVIIPQTLSEITGPVYGHADAKPEEADLTTQHAGEPQGERIIVKGRVLDERGRPVPNTLVEIWQCNAGGRYIHEVDQHPAPLDPNFTGAGRAVTDANGTYQFTTIKPGAYPWRNHANAWRPAHVHFSLFGPSFLTRLVTQMYFPGDPLFPFDPIFNSVGDAKARERMVCRFDMATTKPEWALGYVWDIVLRGSNATPGIPTMPERTPSQTVGPFLHIGLVPGAYGVREVFGATVADPGIPGTHIRIEGRILDGEGNVAPDAMLEIWQADGQGRYAHPADGRPLTSNSFRGFGRCATDKGGGFAFATIKPGSVPGPDGTAQAPHINVGIFSRGLLKRLFTRIYFAGDPANAADPILALVPADRRDTLIAKPDPAKPGLYRFDIRLQGADETVFLDA